MLLALLVSCRKPVPVPTEPMVSVLTATPLLNEIEDDEGAALVGHPGDLVLAGRDLPALRWAGAMGSVQAHREGPMVELRQSAGGGVLYGFRSDLGPAQPVPTAAWICGQLEGAGADCASSLQRVRTSDGAVVAWTPHQPRPTAVVVIRGAALEQVKVSGIAEGRLMTSGTTTLLLLSTRTSSADGITSEGTLTPVRVSGAPMALLEPLITDAVDGRTPGEVRVRLVEVELGEDSVQLRGERRVMPLDGGEPSASTPIDERYVLIGDELVLRAR